MRKTLLLLATMSLALLLAGGVALAAAGDLDTSFGGDGRVTLDIFLDRNDHGNAAAIQSDGKIVVAGTYEGFGSGDSTSVFALARFNPNGSVDTSFGSNGRTLTVFPKDRYQSANAKAVAIQRDGKIVVAGEAHWSRPGSNPPSGSAFALARYNPNGTLDTSFSGDGMLTDTYLRYNVASAVAVQQDGRIVAVGSSATSDQPLFLDECCALFAVARYNTNGTPDTSFSGGVEYGHALTHFEDAWYDVDQAAAVTIQPDGKIVAAGVTWNCDVSWPLSQTQCQNNPFTGTASETDFALARYNTNGSLDTSFGGDGKVVTGFGDWERARGVAVQPNGKIVAAGSRSSDGDGDDFALTRYNTNGSLDTTFNGDGRVETSLDNEDLDASAVAIQWGGKIVAAGSVDPFGTFGGRANFALARYYPNGTLDTTFDGNGLQTTDFGGVEDRDIAKAVAIQRDRRIVVVGSTDAGTDYDFALARYQP